MAARTRKINIGEEWRTKIKVSMLINRLTDHALGNVEMSATQVRAIEVLLKKVAPDLASVEHTGEIVHSYVAEIPAPAQTVDAWQKSLSGDLSQDRKLHS